MQAEEVKRALGGVWILERSENVQAYLAQLGAYVFYFRVSTSKLKYCTCTFTLRFSFASEKTG